MNSVWALMWATLVKDVRLEWRSKDALNSMLFFSPSSLSTRNANPNVGLSAVLIASCSKPDDLLKNSTFFFDAVDSALTPPSNKR